MNKLFDTKKLRFAAIDIGSNAVRFQVSRATPKDESAWPDFKRLEYVRFPLRLGKEVFKEKNISSANRKRFVKLMAAYASLLELYEVEDYLALATSAMREAKNGKDILKEVYEKTGLEVEIISGKREAEMINAAIFPYLTHPYVLHIDVGGGSTEINLYSQSEKIRARSFKIGHVRTFLGETKSETWNELEEWVEEHTPKTTELVAVATGGNINKLGDLITEKKSQIISFNELYAKFQEMNLLTVDELSRYYGLNEDRADVIVPAATIYIRALKPTNVQKIIIPKVGLREGILQTLYSKHRKKILR